ncbi:MAG: restriction endonuclease subunit M, partial [Frankiaceae bacterium]
AVRTNLYTNFMERTWRSAGERGVVGLLHPEGHFTDPKAGQLRRDAYRRLRRHWQFSNHLQMFEEIAAVTYFAINIYGPPRPPTFLSMSNLIDVSVLESSLEHDSSGDVPGIQVPWGSWDLRPHASRIMTVTGRTLTEWADLFDPPGTSGLQARLVRPLTKEHLNVLASIAAQPVRMADVGYEWSRGWNEKTAKDDRYIEWRTEFPGSWKESIWQGPHFTVANPFAKQPNESCRSKGDYNTWDLEELPEQVIPRTNYQRACDLGRYEAGLDHWDGEPFTAFWRLVLRKMTQPGLERSLHAALLPPGPALTGAAQCLGGMDSERDLVCVAGLWSSMPYDYLIKVSGKANIYEEHVARFPAPLDHPAAPYVLLRTLRLNCLTRDYAPLWGELYEPGFAKDSWTPPFADWPNLGVSDKAWTMGTPLRSDYERRAALVEIDALAALMLGLTADHLALMFRAQFPVLRKYEYEMYFDNTGRKIAKDHHAQGVKQQKDDYALLQAYLRGEDCGDLLDRYEPHPDGDTDPVKGFLRPDREAEMRAAYAEFSRRLDQ